MPRDLESEKATLEAMAPLSQETPPDDDQDPLPLYRSHDSDLLVEEKFKKMKHIHPYSLLLNQEDVDECDWLEHVAFDANEAASKEKASIISLVYYSPLLQSPPSTSLSIHIPHTPSLAVSRLARPQAAFPFRHHRYTWSIVRSFLRSYHIPAFTAFLTRTA
jgi:hypothetical protein